MIIVFIGPPAAGKGTQCKRLVDYLNIPHISTGELLRQAIAQQTSLGRMAEGYIKQGKLAPDPLVMSIVADRLDQPDCRRGCLFDGFPRTLIQAESLDLYLRDRGTPLDLVLELKVGEQIILERMAVREKLEHRADDTPETIKARLQVYRQQTTPLLLYYAQRNLLETVDGNGTPEAVFSAIQAIVDRRFQLSGATPGEGSS